MIIRPCCATLAVAVSLSAFPPAVRAQSMTPTTQWAHAAQVIQIIAEDYAFDAPDEIRSGWTTIQFRNEGEETHMVFMSRLPEGKTVTDYETDLSEVFAQAWYAVRDGRVDQEGALTMLGQALPDWFPSLQFVGGPGLLAPGVTSETTLHLEPGNYVLECYVKTEAGEVHFMDGMIRPLVVSGTPSGAAPPAADIRIKLSNYTMEVDGNLTPGRRTIEVHAAENPEEGFGHSVHLARLDSDTDVQTVVQWMNWFGTESYRAPSPVQFIGGMHPLPTGHTGYFTADLEPGRYLLVSEATGHRGVLREVTVR